MLLGQKRQAVVKYPRTWKIGQAGRENEKRGGGSSLLSRPHHVAGLMSHVLKASQQEADIKHPDAGHRHYGLHPQQTAGWPLSV